MNIAQQVGTADQALAWVGIAVLVLLAAVLVAANAISDKKDGRK